MMGHPELAAEIPDEPVDGDDKPPDILSLLHRRPKGEGPGPDLLIGASCTVSIPRRTLTNLQLRCRDITNEAGQRPRRGRVPEVPVRRSKAR